MDLISNFQLFLIPFFLVLFHKRIGAQSQITLLSSEDDTFCSYYQTSLNEEEGMEKGGLRNKMWFLKENYQRRHSF